MKKSTFDLFKRHGLRIDRALHNWIYFVFYNPYVKSSFVATKFIDKHLTWLKPIGWAAGAVFERYHSKVLSVSDVNKILSLEKDLHLGPDEHKQVIPFKYANKVIIREPELIAVMDCPCKIARGADCKPVAACMAIGRDFAPLWLEHCKHNNARQVSREEAQEIIRTLRASGHVQQAFLKVGTGGLTGVICNCCPDCCVSMEANRVAQKINSKLNMNAESGYSVKREAKLCQACGKCVESCPFGAASMENGKPVYDKALCMGCELCVENCPNKALSLYADPEKVLPLDIELLKERI